MMSGSGSMWFGGGFMWIFWILLLVILVWVVKVAMTDAGSKKTMEDDSPLEILKKRYARGDIEEDEFIRRRKELEKK